VAEVGWIKQFRNYLHC